jgi:hypothetical protein
MLTRDSLDWLSRVKVEPVCGELLIKPRRAYWHWLEPVNPQPKADIWNCRLSLPTYILASRKVLL